jgi:hypothetical protein
MDLKEKLYVGALSCSLILLAGGVGNGVYKSTNLEKDAVKCSWVNNGRMIVKSALPFIKNIDLDNDGKYESAYFFKNAHGDISYKLITIGPNGDHIFGESHFYKK